MLHIQKWRVQRQNNPKLQVENIFVCYDLCDEIPSKNWWKSQSFPNDSMHFTCKTKLFYCCDSADGFFMLVPVGCNGKFHWIIHLVEITFIAPYLHLH